MYTVVLLRHGQSQWNLENRFTGWADPALSERGIQEARSAGQRLKDRGYSFDVVFTNVLQRCIKTTWLVLETMNLMWIPVIKDWHLNERFYGALTGLNKMETAEKYGEDQVKIWRRSYDVRPPALDTNHEYYPGKDDRYEGLNSDQLPLTECLKDVVNRVNPYWLDSIAPEVLKNKHVLVSASGNSLRALIKILDQTSEDAILELNVPTGIPLVYELDKELRPVKSYYLATNEELQTAISEVQNQGKKH